MCLIILCTCPFLGPAWGYSRLQVVLCPAAPPTPYLVVAVALSLGAFLLKEAVLSLRSPWSCASHPAGCVPGLLVRTTLHSKE